jgi:hypothetical protein
MNKSIWLSAVALVFLLFVSSCTQQQEEVEVNTTTKEEVTITKDEVIEAQKIWGDGILKIRNTYKEEGDYVAAASEHIDNLYGYQMTEVLFKPTLAAESQFRLDKEGALSYFVGGNDKYKEDKGFAILPWTNVRWENAGIITEGNFAVAMGNYYFTNEDGEETKVEYTFGYTKNSNGELKIVLHHSALPYSPQ